MKLKEGDKFLYKFGLFGTTIGGIFSLFLGKPYVTTLIVEKEKGRLWFRENNGVWFSPIKNEELDDIKDKKFIKRLYKI